MSKNTDLGSLVNYIKGQVTGRLNAPAYTSATAFTGTIAGYLGFDTSGNILTSAGVGFTGSGTTNYIPKFTGSTSLGNSIIYDNGSNIGINTITPNASWGATISNPTLNSSNALRLERNNIPTQGLNISAGGSDVTFNGFDTASGGTNTQFIWTSTAFNTTTERLRIQQSGNICIGNTNNTYKLDVTGDINVSGSFRINGTALITGVSGSGSTNYMPLWTSTTGLGNSIIYNSGGNLGINSTTNGYTLNAIRSASTQFNAVYKGSGSLVQIMARFMGDESSNLGIAIGYASPTYGSSSGIWATQEGALKLGVKDGIFYKTKIQMDSTNVYLDIPTSSAGLSSGAIWNDGTYVRIT